MLNLCLQNVNTSEGKLTVVHNELVHIHGSSPRTTKELDHYLWKAGSHIHHSCLSKRHKKQTFKKWSWVKFSSSGATKRFYYSSHKSHKPAASLFPLKCALYRARTAWSCCPRKCMFLFFLDVFSELLLTQDKPVPRWCKAWENLLVLCAYSGGSVVFVVSLRKLLSHTVMERAGVSMTWYDRRVPNKPNEARLLKNPQMHLTSCFHSCK